jgi:uncharacterized protein (DUF1501 family)
MKRRNFLKYSSAISVPLMVGGFPVVARGADSLLEMIAAASQANGRILVIIQMNGGNDGLNTVIPIDKYTNLVNARPNIVVPQSSILKLKGEANTGFHPSLAEMSTMFNNGLINISQAVSYPNPNFSHFRATDIWFTASDADTNLNTGWLGRSLNEEYPGFPVNYPNTNMPDPLAIQIGSQASISTQGPVTSMNMTVSDPSSFYNLVNGTVDAAPPTPYGHELTYLRLIKQQTNAYSSAVKKAYLGTSTLSKLYPDGNPNASYSEKEMSQQLKIVARLIKGGLKTPVYIVNHPDGFDSHANQVDPGDRTKGVHAQNLKLLSQAVNAFQDDLKLMGVDDRVATMNFTEFGRRIKSNNSTGTDHGTATPVFVIGKNVNPVIIGTSPDIPINATVDDNVPMQHDFRSVYYTVLKDWFELNAAQLNAVLFKSYTILPIFKALVALPVNLLAFTATWQGLEEKDAKLNWEVDAETNIESYTIMRSEDGTQFTSVGNIKALNGTGKHQYSFTDRDLTGKTYYYKLKIAETGVAEKYSEIVVIKKTSDQATMRFKVMPNPFQNFLHISFENKVTGVVAARLIDVSGREIWKGESPISNNYSVYFNLSQNNIAPGIYTLQLKTDDVEGAIKVLKQ